MTVDVDDVKVEKKTGESLKETSLINGIVLDKEIVHSGMPKRVEKAKIALLDASLEIEKTEFDAKINIESPDQIEAFLKQEEAMLKDMAEKIAAAGGIYLRPECLLPKTLSEGRVQARTAKELGRHQAFAHDWQGRPVE